MSKAELKAGDLIICHCDKLEHRELAAGLKFGLDTGNFDGVPRHDCVVHFYTHSELCKKPILILKEDIRVKNSWHFKCLLDGKIMFCMFPIGWERIKWIEKIN